MPRTSPAAGRLGGIVVSPFMIGGLPVTGQGWDDVVDAADNSIANPPMASDQNANHDVYAFAKALCIMRQPSEPDFVNYIDEIHDGISYGITQVSGVYNWLQQGSSTNQPSLARARNITGWVLAADVIGLRKIDRTLYDAFAAFLAGPLRHTVLKSHTLITVAEKRPNNWGTHAQAARLAIAAYLRDEVDWARAVAVYKGQLGDRGAYAGFDFGDLSWQYDENDPVGINEKDATKLDGAELRNIDGALPEELRRSQSFPPSEWPMETDGETKYNYEALQGMLLSACIIHNASRGLMTPSAENPWSYSDNALLRAYLWLNDPARGNFPVNKTNWEEPDDYWQIGIVKRKYGALASALPTISSGHTIGKAFGFSQWFLEDANWLA